MNTVAQTHAHLSSTHNYVALFPKLRNEYKTSITLIVYKHELKNQPLMPYSEWLFHSGSRTELPFLCERFSSHHGH